MPFAASAALVPDRLAVAERALAQARAALRNFAPEAFIDRLIAAPGQFIAEEFDNSSVLFADLVGFVAIAKRLGPRKTVALLDALTREFDDAAAAHGVEKIKTIGDGYMAVAGVTLRWADHRARLARLALDMRDATRRLAEATGLDLKMRIGVASGAVTAGVIGARKMSFDVWGDTVNLAARLERMAGADEILMSDATAAGLGLGFHVDYRGAAHVRGFGVEETWSLRRAGAQGRLH